MTKTIITFLVILKLFCAPIMCLSQTQETWSTEVRMGNYRGTEGQTSHPAHVTVTIPAGAHFVSVEGLVRDGIGDECSCDGPNFKTNTDSWHHDTKCFCDPSPAVSNYQQTCRCVNTRMECIKYSGNTASADFYNWSDCCARYAILYATYAF